MKTMKFSLATVGMAALLAAGASIAAPADVTVNWVGGAPLADTGVSWGVPGRWPTGRTARSSSPALPLWRMPQGRM
jgi:hypothetical protein